MSGLLGGRRRMSGLLALLCLGLGGVIYLQLEEPPLSREARSMPATSGAAKAQEDAAIAIDFELPPLSVFAEITSRPLFSPSRRPAPPPDEEEEVAALEAPPELENDFLLRGVAIAGGDRVALLQRRDTGELVRVLEGQSLDGWRIETIAPGTVAIRGGDEEVLLEIEHDKSPEPPRQAIARRDQISDEGPPPWQSELPADMPPEDELETEADEVELEPEAH